MKIIITEDQQERMRSRISELLNHEFRDSNIICEIKVANVNVDLDDYEIGELKYDVVVYLNESFTRTGGIYGFRVGTEKKIKKLLSNWFNLDENEYSIWILVREC